MTNNKLLLQKAAPDSEKRDHRTQPPSMQAPPHSVNTPDLSNPAHPLTAQRVLQMQQRVGNRAVMRMLAQRQGDHQTSARARSHSAARSTVQRVHESDFKGDPATFMAANIITLDMKKGMTIRADKPELVAQYAAFVIEMGKLDKHWFKFMVDADRTKGDKSAYLLTPAIEKYIAEYHDNAFIQGLSAIGGIPALEGDGDYIASAYVPYFTKKATNPDVNVGHKSIKKSRDAEGFNPDFVFTAAMNGCAFAATPSADDDHFDAWHYQSPGSNKEESSDFRKDKKPTDWFGAEEYDGGDHPGLFEVTNLLWRGDDDNWNVLSQQNETSAHDLNDVTLKNFDSRPLNLDPADGASKLAYTKRIYKGIAADQLNQVTHDYDNLTKKKMGKGEEPMVHKYCQKVMTIMESEVAAIEGATTLETLHAAADTIRLARLAANVAVNGLKQPLVALLTQEDAAERDKWGFRQDKNKLVDLELKMRQITEIDQLWNRTAWIARLISETAPVAQPEAEAVD